MDSYYPYNEREVQADLGVWEIRGTKYKVYGIIADHQNISKGMLNFAFDYVKNDLPNIVTFSEESNGLGFVIIHSGEFGFSVLVHWWEQGSVLCQQVVRKTWEADTIMDMSARRVVACVWELGLINSEQMIWRKTMMNGTPDAIKYVNTRSKVGRV